jgi:hypothetical protein
MSAASDAVLVEIPWAINPFRGDAFEEAWTPVAEAALDFGATWWALYRSTDGTLDFRQLAIFPSKGHFEQYWYSDELSAARVNIAGYYQVPLLPTFHTVSGMGSLAPVLESAGT